MNEEQAYFLHIKWGDLRVYISIGYRIQPVSHCGWIHSLFGVPGKKNGSPLKMLR